MQYVGTNIHFSPTVKILEVTVYLQATCTKNRGQSAQIHSFKFLKATYKAIGRSDVVSPIGAMLIIVALELPTSGNQAYYQ